jgi:inorganic pyrophosphatase
MSLKFVPIGEKYPEEFNVVIEIPMNSDPIKYEIDKETGVLMVDRFMGTAMYYPCNYGYIPQTLGDDGDALDALVYTPFPLMAGSAVRCRALGVLQMEDEAGLDAKLLTIPVPKLLPSHAHIQKPADLGDLFLRQIQHFFEHYKDLESGKWVKVTGWADADAAKKEILKSIKK